MTVKGKGVMHTWFLYGNAQKVIELAPMPEEVKKSTTSLKNNGDAQHITENGTKQEQTNESLKCSDSKPPKLISKSKTCSIF